MNLRLAIFNASHRHNMNRAISMVDKALGIAPEDTNKVFIYRENWELLNEYYRKVILIDYVRSRLDFLMGFETLKSDNV